MEKLDHLVRPYARKALKITGHSADSVFFQKRRSFTGHVDVIAPGESWPMAYEEDYLSPILQICLKDLPRPVPLLSDLAYLTVFMEPEAYYYDDESSGLYIGAYKKGQPVVRLIKPEGVIDNPLCAVFEEIEDYPDWGDLPEAFEAYEKEYENGPYETYMNTKIGGWPFWMQSNEEREGWDVVLQISPEDEPYWDFGDTSTLYILRHRETGDFDGIVQMA